MAKDLKLWLASQQGDQDACTALYRYSMSLVPVSGAFVLDCIHEVFTKIWVKRY